MTTKSPSLEDIIAATPRLLLRQDLCRAANDPKLPGAAVPVYVPTPDYAHALKNLSDPSRAREFNPAADAPRFFGAEAPHGLLYLPFPYLVPGGRFNEMYGWDSAFPVLAWTDEHPRLMREQVDNQLYQIRMYGKVLNANRTYYLSRSQPPLISAMAMRIWEAAQNRDWRDFDPDGLYTGAKDWLARAFGVMEFYYEYWTTRDRLADGGPLSRYWDESDLPAPEVISGEPGHFDHARARFAAGAEDADLFYDAKRDKLIPFYYRADRAMRASGLDPTGHWGYGALRCLYHAPVCLNALLYRMEEDMAAFAGILSQDTATWKKRALTRREAMRALMRDSTTGLYHDYDFGHKTRNRKPFATIFHALWAGLYDGEKVPDAIPGPLETPHGITTSNEDSGSQWDHPYGWPPMQYFAFAGLHRCGRKDDARRIARKYVDLAGRILAEHGTLFEKYNMAEGSADIHVIHGYHENVHEKGTFLWTAATLKLALDLLKAG